jgi:hypothetical protein
MYLVTGKIVRPNTNCSFYTIADPIVDDSIRAYWQSQFKDTGKCLFVQVEVSPNDLELQTSQYWADEASYNEYKNDAVLTAGLFSLRSQYWAENGMTGNVISEATV